MGEKGKGKSGLGVKNKEAREARAGRRRETTVLITY